MLPLRFVNFGGIVLQTIKGGTIMKKRVHYAELEDMKKYIKGFNPNDYESYGGYTDPSVTSYVRDYYDNHLPVDVTAWMRVNQPNENLIYAEELGFQVRFVRDVLCELLMANNEEMSENLPLVISTHYSKSVKLPVFQINLEKYGIEMILRYNFYDWKISIKSIKPLDFDFMGLFNPTEEISYLCCEGFPRNKVYGSYEQNHSQFTTSIVSHYELYTFIFLLQHYLRNKN